MIYITNELDFKIGKANLMTNQSGYVQYREHYLFDAGKVLELYWNHNIGNFEQLKDK